MNAKIWAPRIFGRAVLAGLMLLGSCLLGQNAPSESAAAARMRALNNSLLALHGQMQSADVNSARTLRGQAATVIAKRAAALTSLIQKEPRTALSFAFSAELLTDLAAKFPQSAVQLESHATVTGPTQHWIADYPGFKSSRSWWVMNSGGKGLYLFFAANEPGNLKSNQLLQATGVVAGSVMAVETSSLVPVTSASSGSIAAYEHLARAGPEPRAWPGFSYLILGVVLSVPFGRKPRITRKQGLNFLKHFAVFGTIFVLIVSGTRPSFAQNTCSTTGAQNTLVILVNLPGGWLPSGVTVSAMQDVFFASNTAGVSLDGFLREASYGQTSAAGQVVGPFNLTGTYTSCSDVGGAILNDAVAAAIASGVNLNNYTRVFLVFPDIFGCGWAGFTQTGSCSLTSTSGTFNSSITFISAAYATPRSTGVSIVSHEIGHNFGLLHSGTITPSTATDVIGPLTSAGAETDMGDYWSVMGETVLGLYAGPQKTNILGWLTSPANVQTVTASGTYTLQPLETSPAGLQVLQVQRGTSNPGYYLWVEYRQPIGDYDSTLIDTSPGVFSGAMIHYQGSADNPAHTYLPNFTPSDTSDNNPELTAGQTWSDPYSNLSISVVSATSSGVTVNVNYGAMPCTTSAPTVVVSPLDPSIYPGQSAGYTAMITDNDSSGCSSSTINLSSSAPAGWSTSFSSSSVALSPGQSASVTMGKGAPVGTAAGTYGVNLNATKDSTSGSGTANATVMTPPSMSVSLAVSGSTFVPPATVSLSASVLNGGIPSSGTSVTFTITSPNGSTTRQSATTNSSGVATWNYKLSGKSTPGTYSAVAQAGGSSGSGGKKGGASVTQSASSSPISFLVQ